MTTPQANFDAAARRTAAKAKANVTLAEFMLCDEPVQIGDSAIHAYFTLHLPGVAIHRCALARRSDGVFRLWTPRLKQKTGITAAAVRLSEAALAEATAKATAKVEKMQGPGASLPPSDRTPVCDPSLNSNTVFSRAREGSPLYD